MPAVNNRSTSGWQLLPEPADGNRDRGPALLFSFWIPFLFAIALVIGRLFVRMRLRNLGLDDYTMFASFVFYTVSIIFATLSVIHGDGRHLIYLRPEQIMQELKYGFIASPFQCLAAALGKISVGLLILRIVGPSLLWQKWVIHTNVAIFTLSTLLFIAVHLADCTPIRGFWDLTVKSKRLNPKIYVDVSILQSAYGAFVDFIFAILPTTIFWNMNMTLSRKITLAGLMGLGLFAGIVTALKTSYILGFAHTRDYSWEIYDIYIWSYLENALVIICGSIPTVKPIFDYLAKGKTLRPFRSVERPTKPSYRRHHSNDTENADMLSSKITTGSKEADSPSMISNDQDHELNSIKVT